MQATTMKYVRQLAIASVGFVVIVAINGTGIAGAGSKPKDVCIAAPTGGGGFNTFILKEVDTLVPGAVAALRGLYFATGQHRIAPLSGSAVMGSDGQIRIGFFVHSSAQATNDFTVSGVTDADYNGTVNFDNDGDFMANGTLAMQRVDCSTITIPQ
jgi:hypothetical protein